MLQPQPPPPPHIAVRAAPFTNIANIFPIPDCRHPNPDTDTQRHAFSSPFPSLSRDKLPRQRLPHRSILVAAGQVFSNSALQAVFGLAVSDGQTPPLFAISSRFMMVLIKQPSFQDLEVSKSGYGSRTGLWLKGLKAFLGSHTTLANAQQCSFSGVAWLVCMIRIS